MVRSYVTLVRNDNSFAFSINKWNSYYQFIEMAINSLYMHAIGLYGTMCTGNSVFMLSNKIMNKCLWHSTYHEYK
jgi:hypothetical protein